MYLFSQHFEEHTRRLPVYIIDTVYLRRTIKLLISSCKDWVNTSKNKIAQNIHQVFARDTFDRLQRLSVASGAQSS